MMATLFALENSVRHYAWGSHTSLASIRGEGATSEPEAELWMGAHPSLPSRALTDSGSRTLPELFSEDPLGTLGANVAREFGTLPFLLKLLAASAPLSLQAHPSAEQAREGFAREEASHIERDAPTRNYRDAQPKPELIVALTPFSALIGFRTPARTRRLFDLIANPALAPLSKALEHPDASRALRTYFDIVANADTDRQRELAEATLAGCRANLGRGGEFERELGWAARIGELHPGDPGIVLALALNLVVLEPGEALYQPPGKLHAYLDGTGVELMTSSDNVLRGGLTQKHVDVQELARVLDFGTDEVEVAPTELVGAELRYLTPVREFALSRLDLHGERATLKDVTGPEILVVTRGALELARGSTRLGLRAGGSVFVPAAGGDYTLAGDGTAFRARVP